MIYLNNSLTIKYNFLKYENIFSLIFSLKFFVIVFFLLWKSSSVAQNNNNNNNNNTIVVDYDINLEFKKYSKYKGTLILDNQSSFFTYKSKQLYEEENKDDFGNLSIVISDPVKYALLTKKTSNKFYEIQSNISSHGIIDSNNPIKWEFVKDSVKKIGDFKCNLAKAKVKGRLYFSWYTLEIPSKLGPWKLHGLPGLILQAYDSLDKVSFTVTKITRSNKNVPFLPKNNYKWISREAFNKIQLKKLEELMARIAAKGARNDKFKYSVRLEEQLELK